MLGRVDGPALLTYLCNYTGCNYTGTRTESRGQVLEVKRCIREARDRCNVRETAGRINSLPMIHDPIQLQCQTSVLKHDQFGRSAAPVSEPEAKEKHTATGVPTSSLTAVLASRFTACVW